MIFSKEADLTANATRFDQSFLDVADDLTRPQANQEPIYRDVTGLQDSFPVRSVHGSPS